MINRAAGAVKIWMVIYAALVAAAMVAGQRAGAYPSAPSKVSPVTIGRSANEFTVETLMRRDVPTRRSDI